MTTLPRPSLTALWSVFTALILAATGVAADELAATGVGRVLAIHDAASTLRDYCTRDEDGRLWFTIPGAARYELVTSTSDPRIVNPGDGEFHPFDPNVVRSAIAEVRFPLGGIAADVFILPYPRRAQVESAAGPGLILLSPGVRPLSREHQHAEFVHELGHVIQHACLPDGGEPWTTYRRLREIDDESRFSSTSPHADRPHEIFAEDFRALFGGPSATYSGSIENDSLAPPNAVPGLESFLIGLSLADLAPEFTAAPNPTRGTLRFERGLVDLVPLDLFDAAGRHVATLAPRRARGGVEWSFGGIDDAGRPVRPGVLFARLRGVPHAAARVVVLP